MAVELRSRLTRWGVLVHVVGLVAGALFSSTSRAAKGADLRSTTANLPDLIRKQTRANQQQATALDAIQAQVDALEKSSAPFDQDLKRLQTQAAALALQVGRTPVQGPGITVSLNDSPLRGSQIPDGLGVDDIVVHQQDVQAVVNALWRGGAEAMMLMDQRVISTSAVRCVGNTLILQGRVYSPPFIIRAIGDRSTLSAALDEDPQVSLYREYVAVAQLGYDVKTSSNLTFPAFSGSIKMTYAATGS
jgi:uncharacterized protein YlxW (UPF0749 family)